MIPRRTRDALRGILARWLTPAQRSAPYLLVLVAFSLLMFQLDAKSLSGDEIGNVQIERGDLAWIIASMAGAWSQHPPGSHLLMHPWIRLVGQGDFVVRYPAVFWATFSVPLLYRLGRRWFGPRIALRAAMLLAFAPDLILYGRMEKYYSLIVALVLVSVLLFDQTIRRPRSAFCLIQGLLSLVILYTDYFAALFVVGVQNIIALLAWRRAPARLAQWLIPQIAALLLFLPFANILFTQAHLLVNGPAADLATGWLAAVAKSAYFPYAFSVGETIFPWEPTAVIGLLIYCLLALLGWRGWLFRQRRGWTTPGVWCAAFLAAPIVGSIVLTSTMLKTIPLITLPNHVMFVLPFFALLVATGLSQARRWHIPLTGLTLVMLLPSLLNYYAGRQFHNPVFVTPSREVLRYIVERSTPGDVLVADVASGVDYYYQQRNIAQPSLLNAQELNDRLQAGQLQRVWLVEVGKDRMRQIAPDSFATWLAQDFQIAQTTGFAEQDDIYRKLKARLTGRPAYQYRVVVQLFINPHTAAGPLTLAVADVILTTPNDWITTP